MKLKVIAPAGMGVLNTIRDAVGRNPSVLYECRDCGEKIEDDVEECPACESDEIARYQF